MSLALDWKIQIGNTTQYDFSSRTLGLSIDQQLQWMRPAAQVATLTLNNYDGALTPDEIGGNGTYKALNWFRQVVTITAKVTRSTGTVTEKGTFYGFVDGFELEDNGRYSTVTITAVDWLTVASRSEAIASLALGDRDIQFLLAGVVGRLDTEADLPYYGIYPPVTVYRKLSDDVADLRAGIVLNDTFQSQTGSVGDQLANQIMPSGLCLMWAASMAYVSGPNATYEAAMIGNTLNRIAAPPTGWERWTFNLKAGTTANNELDVVDIEYGYAIENLANQARISNGTNTANVKYTTSINAYGNAMFEATDTINANLASATTQANAVSQRFGFLSYRPIAVTLTSANLANANDGSDDVLAELLSINGLWQRVELTVTPTGGTSKLTKHLILSRSINATPKDTTIRLGLVGQNQFQSFILNTSELDFERLA